MKRLLLEKTIIVITLIVFILSGVTFAESALLGVNRANLVYDNVLRNGYAEQQITVTIGTPNDVLISFEARGDIANWIRFEPEDKMLIINQDNPGIINVIVEPPSDARVDSYEGLVLITTGALGNVTSTMGTNVIVAFEVKVLINITDTQILSCTAGGLDLTDIEIGENNILKANIKNTGNVRIRPTFNIEIYSQMQDTLIKELNHASTTDITPTKSSLIEESINLNLEPGQYWARINEPICGSSSLITFNVLERGGISDEGELNKINAKVWANTNEIIPITAIFTNKGSRTVSAQFKGIITKNDKVLEIIESEIINVPPNQEVNLETFYTPKEIGQYKISGRVHFNNKVTYERGTIMNVNEEEIINKENENFEFLTIFLSLIIIISTILTFLILKKEKKRKKKI